MVRVLLCGEVRGRISALLPLLQALQKKGPFDFVLCTGNFFLCSEKASSDYVSESFRVSHAGSDLQDAAREALSRSFNDVYEELRRFCDELPLPIYIVDEAASCCVQSMQLQRARQAEPAENAGEAPDSEGVKAEVLGDCQSASACQETDACVVIKRDKHPTENPDAGLPEAGLHSSSSVSNACGFASTPLQLMPNVCLLPSAGVVQLGGLNVAFFSPSEATHQPPCKAEPNSQKPQEAGDADSSFSQQLMSGWGGFKAFRGRTDILLTTRAPKGIFDGLASEAKPSLPQKEEQQKAGGGLGSDTADVKNAGADGNAVLKRCPQSSCLLDFLEPRHAICSGLGIFWQRPHFRGMHFGYSVRLISLGVVGEKGPQAKAFHALQLQPITRMLQLLEHSDPNSRPHQHRQDAQGTTESEEAAQEARAALYFLPPDRSSSNPFAGTYRDSRAQFPVSQNNDASDLTVAGSTFQGPSRMPKRRRETGVVLVENLPYEVTDGEALEKAMNRFGQVKFVFIPKDKADPLKGTGKAFVVYTDPNNAAKATEASGQLESGGRSLRMRLHYDKIPFDRRVGAKRVKCGDVIKTEPHTDCWFCLANPQVEKHMIVDIGDLMYCAVPKGGLVPKHVLIIPIAHLPSLAYADEDTRREASLTIERLRKSFHKEGLDLVVYERYVPMKATRAMHFQIHAIPCQRSEALKAAEFFEKRARRAGLTLQRLQPAENLNALQETASDPRLGYFYVEIPGICTSQGQTVDRFLHVQPAECSGKIPMNFGREVMAELLGEKQKMNWQACVVSRDEEEMLAGALRKMLGNP